MEYIGLITIVPKNNHYLDGPYFTRDTVVIDAEPNVMAMARKLFDTGKTEIAAGKHTHRVLSFPITSTTSKDLIWFSTRYNLEFLDDAFDRLKVKSDEYDRILSTLSVADKDGFTNYTPQSAIPAVTLREHQNQAVNFQKVVKKFLLADKLGLGKTFSGLGCLTEPESRPAMVICPPTLCLQWEREVKRLYPGMTTKIIMGHKPTELPNVDVYITSYNRLTYWQDTIVPMEIKSLIMDEVHELRHTGTAKRETSAILAKNAENVIGLSGTPIFNYGSEIWSIADVIRPGCLGDAYDFYSEWCVDGKLREPEVLHKHLRNIGMMLRRTPEDVGLKFGEATKHVYTIDADLASLTKLESTMKTLAMTLLANSVGGLSSSDAAREFDYKLRHATGVAKAKSITEFVKMIVDQGEKVLLAGWHRSCYDIYLKELKDYHPVMITGTESPKQKQANIDKFINDDSCKVIIFSHISGAGVDGLQHVCSTVVFGELAWSPRVMDQLVGRVDRDGQTKHCNAYYLTLSDGADPFMMSIIQDKNSQHKGLVEGKVAEAELLESTVADANRIQEMAKAYLLSIGEKIPEPVAVTGDLKIVSDLLKRIKVTSNTEQEIQESLHKILPVELEGLKVTREARIGKRMRLDFLVEGQSEKIAIEIKKDSGDKASVYRQVRKYTKDAGITSLILYAPWFGIGDFSVDGIPVIVIDYSKLNI